MGYLRIATHASIFDAPLSPAQAESNVESLLARRHVRLLDERGALWSRYKNLSAQVPVRGNAVPDAFLAAILLTNGVTTLYTRDRDFLKFDGLDVRDPFV